jgi:hypothetical protein
MTTGKQYDYLNRLTSINSTTNSVAVASFNYKGVGPGKQVNGVGNARSIGDDTGLWLARCELNTPARCIT